MCGRQSPGHQEGREEVILPRSRRPHTPSWSLSPCCGVSIFGENKARESLKNRACRGDGANGREQHGAGLKLRVCRTPRPRISLDGAGGGVSRGEGAGGTLWLGSGLQREVGRAPTQTPAGLGSGQRARCGREACAPHGSPQAWLRVKFVARAGPRGSGHFHGPGPPHAWIRDRSQMQTATSRFP